MRQIGDGGVSVQDGAVIHHDLQNNLENSNEVASLWSQEHLQNSSSIDKQIIEDSREWSEDFAAHPGVNNYHFVWSSPYLFENFLTYFL